MNTNVSMMLRLGLQQVLSGKYVGWVEGLPIGMLRFSIEFKPSVLKELHLALVAEKLLEAGEQGLELKTHGRYTLLLERINGRRINPKTLEEMKALLFSPITLAVCLTRQYKAWKIFKVPLLSAGDIKQFQRGTLLQEYLVDLQNG